jgi:CRP-like cAMP-binding protein
MPDTIHADLLQRLPFLRELEPSELQTILQALEQESYSAGDIIAQQGTPARGIFLIMEGKVDMVRQNSDGEVEHGILIGEGQSLGVLEVVNGVPWWGTLRSRGVTTLIRWPRPAISLFIQSHPQVLSDLKHTARMQNLLYRQKFTWLGENEAICAVARKHRVMIIQALLLPIIALALGIASWIWTPFDNENLSFWIGLGMSLSGLGLGLWRWIDWGNDFSIVTNRRAVMLEKVIGIYDNRQETPLQWVLSVSVGTGALGRLLGFGDLIIRTYTGELIFRNVPNPFMFASIVEDSWMRYKHSRKLTDREDMVDVIKERISDFEETDLEPDEELRLIDRQIQRADKGDSKIGLDRWTLKTRFEEQGVITYRRHWAILLRQIFAPSFLIALTTVLLLLRLTGSFEDLERGVSLLIGASVIFISILWWVYRYIDWANDIYQITPNHIVDVNKKPLAREVRMVAPLENILGTEIDRTGIFGVVEWLSAYHQEVNPPEAETEESSEFNDNP